MSEAMDPICKLCGIRPAKIHYTEVVDDKVVDLDLCIECAEMRGIEVPTGGSMEMGDLAAGLINSLIGGETEKLGKVHCALCGYAYSNFKKMGRFGCPECYDSFRAQVLPLLRQIHGSVSHKGKALTGTGPDAKLMRELAGLKEELSRAVELEEYEKAAEIRDRIKRIEEKLEEE